MGAQNEWDVPPSDAENFYVDEEGNPILDEHGKPIFVDEDPCEVECPDCGHTTHIFDDDPENWCDYEAGMICCPVCSKEIGYMDDLLSS